VLMADEDVKMNQYRFIDAAKKGSDDILEQYLDDTSYGVTVNTIDSLGETALHWASRAGHESSVEFLLKRGANVNAQDRSGETPLHKAAWRSQEDTIKLLLKYGANRDVENKEGKKPVDHAKDSDTRRILLPPVEAGPEDQQYEHEDEDSD